VFVSKAYYLPRVALASTAMKVIIGLSVSMVFVMYEHRVIEEQLEDVGQHKNSVSYFASRLQ
jgi:methanogenic corrinoid protein MtbC1